MSRSLLSSTSPKKLKLWALTKIKTFWRQKAIELKLGGLKLGRVPVEVSNSNWMGRMLVTLACYGENIKRFERSWFYAPFAHSYWQTNYLPCAVTCSCQILSLALYTPAVRLSPLHCTTTYKLAPTATAGITRKQTNTRDTTPRMPLLAKVENFDEIYLKIKFFVVIKIISNHYILKLI